MFFDCKFIQSNGDCKKNTVEVYILPSYGSLGGGGTANFGIGIDYSRRLTERWSLGVGFERIAITNRNKSVILYEQSGDEVVTKATTQKGLFFDWKITSIPIQIKYHLTKAIYFNFGPSLDMMNISPNIDNEFGIGLRVGAGFEHEFNNGIMLLLNPYLKTDFSSGDIGYYQIAVNLGIGYKF